MWTFTIIVLAIPVFLNLTFKWLVAPILMKGKNAMAVASVREPAVPEKLSPEMREFLGQMDFVWRLTSALRRSRRRPVAWASHDSLRFARTPGPKTSGQLKRDQIESFRIAFDQIGLGKKVFRLEAVIRGAAKAQPFFLSCQRETIEEMKKALLQAMGISV